MPQVREIHNVVVNALGKPNLTYKKRNLPQIVFFPARFDKLGRELGVGTSPPSLAPKFSGQLGPKIECRKSRKSPKRGPSILCMHQICYWVISCGQARQTDVMNKSSYPILSLHLSKKRKSKKNEMIKTEVKK